MKSLVFILITFFTTNSLLSQTYSGNEADINQILENTKAFSEYIKSADYKMIGASYTLDAKIFPNNLEIIEGRDSIVKYWNMPKDSSIKYHEVTSSEIKILGDEAYDYGIYEGTTLLASGEEASWKGKYVIVWKKIKGDWKMYLDIWNKIN